LRPLIGITGNYNDARTPGKDYQRDILGRDIHSTSLDYARNIERAGGIPLSIPTILKEGYIEGVIDSIDGLLLSGGADIHPKHYGQSIKRGLGSAGGIRDDFEIALLKKAVEKGIPVLGICRGFQLINVAFGGTLVQDIQLYHKTQIQHVGIGLMKDDIAHKVFLLGDSILHNIYGKETLHVNSYHHQIIDEVSEQLVAIATSEDGIVEGLVHATYPGIFGVQWHPEMMAETSGEQFKLFEGFLALVTR